jgi:hypothetical protein
MRNPSSSTPPEMKPLRRLESKRFFLTLCVAFLFTQRGCYCHRNQPITLPGSWIKSHNSGVGITSCLPHFEIRNASRRV